MSAQIYLATAGNGLPFWVGVVGVVLVAIILLVARRFGGMRRD